MLYKSNVILTKALLALVEFKYWREPEFKEVMVKYGHNEMDLIEISVVLPWTTSRQRKLISNDSELYSVFEEIFTNSCPVIEFMVHTGLGGQSCHESVVIGYENPVNIGVSMGSDKFEKLSEDGFIGGHSSDEENRKHDCQIKSVNKDATTPWIAKALVGRPKKKRTKEPGETKLTSKMFTIKCSACICLGHNKRGCPNFPKTTRTIEHGTNPQSQEVDVNEQSIFNLVLLRPNVIVM
ncbi:hypothetical protein CUMW_172190 [Citrus unshiu]|uniref:Uncharacterized protein n=1 Tax=Citrus unshiu TaxID=55188 RepID=A0A2H5PWN5_CITUN|nr:hypothetical protein CUMW_172190 [Citrus unshiu]